MELPPVEIVIIDECHHVRPRTYQSIIEAYPNVALWIELEIEPALLTSSESFLLATR
jgi:hypothetical protein